MSNLFRLCLLFISVIILVYLRPCELRALVRDVDQANAGLACRPSALWGPRPCGLATVWRARGGNHDVACCMCRA